MTMTTSFKPGQRRRELANQLREEVRNRQSHKNSLETEKTSTLGELGDLERRAADTGALVERLRERQNCSVLNDWVKILEQELDDVNREIRLKRGCVHKLDRFLTELDAQIIEFSKAVNELQSLENEDLQCKSGPSSHFVTHGETAGILTSR